MDINTELSNYNVSRETIKKLEDFSEILCEWNEKMNLVSRNSINDLWKRHILDSLQLLNYIPNNIKTLLDIGSGAGFPGVVLAIAMQEKIPQASVFLVESITKKTMYLNDVCERLGLSSIRVINDRVENAVFKSPDVVTARAVASLDVLCGYVNKISKQTTKALFLKGKSYQDEIDLSLKSWSFDMKVHQNKYDNEGVILQLGKIRKVR